MDRVALRTLTYKSQMKFGKYADLTVRQLIDLNPIDGVYYLIWSYYNSSNISFNDEILDFLGITEDLRIMKPSKVSSEEYYRLKGKVIQNRNSFSDKEIKHQMGIKQTEKKHKALQNIGKSTSLQNKKRLQTRNHGINRFRA